MVTWLVCYLDWYGNLQLVTTCFSTTFLSQIIISTTLSCLQLLFHLWLLWKAFQIKKQQNLEKVKIKEILKVLKFLKVSEVNKTLAHFLATSFFFLYKPDKSIKLYLIFYFAEPQAAGINHTGPDVMEIKHAEYHPVEVMTTVRMNRDGYNISLAVEI